MAPTLGNINTVGTGSITVVGNPGTSTLTTQLTGLTNHDVLVGAGTATITSVSPSTAGFVLTSNGVSADPSFQAASASGAITTITGNSGGAEVPSAGNFNILGTGSITVAGSANTETVELTGLTNHSLLVGAGTPTITSLGVATNGQLPIGSTGADPVLATLTPGTGISITNGAGSISIAVNGAVVGETITGNTGGALSPTLGNWNTLGTGSITIAGSGSTLTSQLTGLTNHAVQVGAGTATLTQLAVGTNGQVLIGATTADPAFATLTSSDSSISFTTGANTLSLQVAGGSTAIKTITGNSGGAESPSAGNFNILGTGSITVAGSANTETVQLTGLTNHALQVGAGTATLTQLGAGTTGQVLQTNTGADPTWSTATYPSTTTINQLLYSSSANTVAGLATANNGVHITGTTGIPSVLAAGTTGQILTATTGSPPSWASPATSGTVTSVSVVSANGFAGTVATATTTPAITLTTTQTGLLSGNGTAVTGTPITQYNVLTGGASNAPNSVAPSATSGVPVISQGSSAQPIFGTAVVAGGGTGDTSFTAYSVITGGTTSTGALQNVSGVGTSGQVLTSNGAAALPTWQSVTVPSLSINIQTFTSSGTYTPTAGMDYCIIECIGGGGGGGGTGNTGATGGAAGGGGGGGAYSRKFASAATIGASQTATVGAAGSAGASGNNAGGNGGATSVGTICTANGGTGGGGNSGSGLASGGAGGTVGTGDFSVVGQAGAGAINATVTSVVVPYGAGGASCLGFGGAATITTSATTGNAGQSYGGGGSGGASLGAGGAAAGGAGAKGIIIITEYIT